MVKRIQLSADAGSNYYTLPGSSGSVSSEAGQLNDTIFGQAFSSAYPGLIGWTISANGIFKGFAGYVVDILISGTSTAMTDEACTVVTGKTFQIDDAVKQVFDVDTAMTFEDEGTPITAANVESIDYLFGKVTFVAGYTVSGAITVATGNYLPTAAVGGAKSFTLTQTAAMIDNTTIALAQANSGHRTFEGGLKTVTLELGGVYALTNAFKANLVARNKFVVEINPDGSDLAVARGIFRFNTQGQSGDVGALEEETATLSLAVPDEEKLLTPFAWNIATTSTLSQALQIAITSWEDATVIDARYLPSGTAGVEGNVVLSDISLSGGLEAMNEFTVSLQGSGSLDAVV